MFELSVACKYLLPRRRQLSVSIISLISTLVIALVVWLIVVFLSVTDGLEKNWIRKLTALTAPVRLVPTDAYYHSYYYQIDSISEASGYSHKTIREKQQSLVTDPYNPEYDEEIPPYWPAPDRQSDGQLKDLVKLAYASIAEIQDMADLKARDFELTMSQIRLRLLREANLPYFNSMSTGTTQSSLSYPTYLGNFESDNDSILNTLLPIRLSETNNVLNLMGLIHDVQHEEPVETKTFFNPAVLQKRLHRFFQSIHVTHLKTHSSGWRLPASFLPPHTQWTACLLLKDDKIVRLIIPVDTQHIPAIEAAMDEQGFTIATGTLHLEPNQKTITLPNQEPRPLPNHLPLILEGGVEFPAQLLLESIDKAKRVEDLQFTIQLTIQQTPIQTHVAYRGLEIGAAHINSSSDPTTSPLWIHHVKDQKGQLHAILPRDPEVGEGVLLPKSFKEAGVLIGDRGYLTYFSPTTSVILEQHLPIYVAGFYDPGIIPIGGKFILAHPSVTSLIRTAHSNQDEKHLTNGINVRFSHIQQAEEVKEQLLQAFKNKGISRYWNIETYREYEFTKEIIHELQSQKNLFTLIAIVIIMVACSNIISMLIILVNDKKTEIGILRSMGASSKSIALIFGLAGGLIGMMGSLIGIGAAILTLRHLQILIGLISQIQGHQMFSASVYGDVLPHELSYEALLFVLMATIIISLLAGIVPAVKACLVRPSHILRSTGE